MESPTNPTNSTNGLSLPPVQPPVSASPDPATPAAKPETSAAVPPVNGQPAASAPAVPPVQASVDDATPLIADDADLIEKEWVVKAKQLVDQTKDDPYKQNKEINKFKATYIKKRYNKDIHLSKD